MAKDLKQLAKKKRAALWKWTDGPPKKPGLYWLQLAYRKEDEFCGGTVCQTRRYKGELIHWTCGHGGSGPMDIIYREGIGVRIRHRAIDPPDPKEKWFFSTNPGRYAWCKDKEGYLAFCLLTPDYTGAGGTQVFLDHPHNSSVCGQWFRERDGFKFKRVKDGPQ